MFAKIMTFNLRLNVASDGENAWPYRTKAVAEVIKRHDADIIGIQEGLHDMLTDLEPLLPEYAWIGEGREGGNKGEYAAILYKKKNWTVGKAGHFSLSETPEELGARSWSTSHPRMCTWVTFKSQTGAEFAAFNTHLDHISEEAQQKGMELIRERMKEFRTQTGLPVVLTGDFNVEPANAVITGLEQEGYRNAYSVLQQEKKEVGATVHHFLGGESGEPIDYIFVSPDLQIQNVRVDRELYEGRYPSDHYPVIAEVSPL
ncbi:endonuclease/exonuclease/phosphatase family protein [Paenibacillus sp. MB22_1]|uniref:endonuclease/exonuclease/phosphatase family protein n=1 Tax=Paenibacillus TaxID=44249 RepID=UPI0001AFD355|nr:MULTISPECIES: endonuclease/exonuclease/phosphatase family protein [unclassified Paenibacillus]EES74408.1 endonuclease/exonuclease/phosphatase family protein [Paenibacillus sp. oral taxon 786 str. D14]MCT2194802.1 endonuclease/exonuclease/phosphatase family protein [Paenibacillus sp. p3-SID1389]